jgi:hypothetical protein
MLAGSTQSIGTVLRLAATMQLSNIGEDSSKQNTAAPADHAELAKNVQFSTNGEDCEQ